MAAASSALALVALLGTGALPPSAAEAPARALLVELDWRVGADHSCLSSTSFQQAVEQQLERKVFTAPSDADVTLTVAVGGDTGELQLALSQRGKSLGSRAVEVRPDTPCARLQETSSLIVAMLIDTSAEQLEQQESPAAPAVLVTRSIAAEPVEPAPTAPARDSGRTSFQAAGSFSLALSTGLLPTPALGGRLELTLARSWARRPHLALEYAPNSTLEEPDGRVTFSAATIAVGYGWWLTSGELSVAPRMEIAATLVSAQATGFRDSYSTRLLAFGTALGARAEWSLSRRAFLCADAALRVTPVRPRFQYIYTSTAADPARTGEAFETSLWGFHGGLGAGLKF